MKIKNAKIMMILLFQKRGLFVIFPKIFLKIGPIPISLLKNIRLQKSIFGAHSWLFYNSSPTLFLANTKARVYPAGVKQ